MQTCAAGRWCGRPGRRTTVGWCGRVTLLAICLRSALIDMADRVYRIESGKVSEATEERSGTPEC